MSASATSPNFEHEGANRLPAPLRPSWRTFCKRRIFELGWVDRILSRRAIDLVRRINFQDYLVPDGVHIDIGSGTGHNTARMARVAGECNMRVIGVEPVTTPTRRILDHVRRRDIGPLEFIRAMGNALPMPDDHADGASAFFVLHHIPYTVQLEVLGEMKRVLKPGGRIFIWEDTPENEVEFLANEAWDRRLNLEPRSEPHYYRNADEWVILFEELGFTLLERHYFEDHSKRKREGRIRHAGFVFQTGNGLFPSPSVRGEG